MLISKKANKLKIEEKIKVRLEFICQKNPAIILEGKAIKPIIV